MLQNPIANATNAGRKDTFQRIAFVVHVERRDTLLQDVLKVELVQAKGSKPSLTLESLEESTL